MFSYLDVYNCIEKLHNISVKFMYFRWRTGNDTLLPREESSDPLKSELELDASVASLGTYYCYVNNSVGDAIPCEIDITGEFRILLIVGENSGLFLKGLTFCFRKLLRHL